MSSLIPFSLVLSVVLQFPTIPSAERVSLLVLSGFELLWRSKYAIKNARRKRPTYHHSNSFYYINFFFKFSKFNYNFSLRPFHFCCIRLAFKFKFNQNPMKIILSYNNYHLVFFLISLHLRLSTQMKLQSS